ncbi:hypothetical protein [Lentibacillus sp.]|uniref:hypothetical protein n=1 Tax=Lentibacillus sp. TaxID=1925746 RepID=UPI002B4AC45B|nr:hypothetical protein [Lentibacillus sp.]HLS08220.1 hypothetical protein [Lentibacillus sp.]
MTSGFRVILLFLGTGVISVWTTVAFLFFSDEQTPVTAQTHGKAQIGMIANKEMAFQSGADDAGSVYAITNKEKYNSRKLSNMTNDDAGKVSIDILLEELELE